MSKNNKNLKNHQLLENCGVKLFKKIERKKILKSFKGNSEDVLISQVNSDQK